MLNWPPLDPGGEQGAVSACAPLAIGGGAGDQVVVRRRIPRRRLSPSKGWLMKYCGLGRSNVGFGSDEGISPRVRRRPATGGQIYSPELNVSLHEA